MTIIATDSIRISNEGDSSNSDDENFDVVDLDAIPIRTNNKSSKRSDIVSWLLFREKIRMPFIQGSLQMSKAASLYPVYTIICITVLSFTIVFIGLLTNFNIESTEEALWKMRGSTTSKHHEWIKTKSNFESETQNLLVLIHANGEDVIGVEGIDHVFDVVETIQNLDVYKELCPRDDICQLNSPTAFWPQNNREHFRIFVETDEDAREALSSFTFANGEFVNRDFILGENEPKFDMNGFQRFYVMETALASRSNQTVTSVQANFLENASKEFKLEFAKSFLISWIIPDAEETYQQKMKFENDAIAALLKIKEKWSKNNDLFTLSMDCDICRKRELERGILQDLPLIISSFSIVGLLHMFSYFSKNCRRSQMILGIGAIFTVFLSFMTSLGLLFCIGIPFTPLIYYLPFIILGKGLNDTYILMNRFRETDIRKDIILRINDAVEATCVGMLLSSLTTIATYALSSINTPSAIRWFCIYAGLLGCIQFVYQITFFVALIVLEDKRMRSNRNDCIFCIKNEGALNDHVFEEEQEKKTQLQEIIGAYTQAIQHQTSKQFIISFFALIFFISAYIATKAETKFNMKKMYPLDSFILKNINDMDKYASSYCSNKAEIYFRNVDVSQQKTKDAMISYMHDLINTHYISSPPFTFWLLDFSNFVEDHQILHNETFSKQVDLFLQTHPYDYLHSKDIVRDAWGNITASRTRIMFDEVKQFDVKAQRSAFNKQLEITMNQPKNEASDDLSFFTYGKMYYKWELWEKLGKETIATAIYSLCLILCLSLLFLAQPSASFLLVSTVFMIYLELLAWTILCGLGFNILTAISILASVGIIFDYTIHYSASYFEIEEKNGKTEKNMLTVGTSILQGGLTIFLGILPLGYQSTLVIRTMFVTLVGVVILGILHGLLFIPVVLSYFDENTIETLQTSPRRNLGVFDNSNENSKQNEGVWEKGESDNIKDLQLKEIVLL